MVYWVQRCGGVKHRSARRGAYAPRRPAGNARYKRLLPHRDSEGLRGVADHAACLVDSRHEKAEAVGGVGIQRARRHIQVHGGGVGNGDGRALGL